jgi:phosphatidylglycerophosphate synthase
MKPAERSGLALAADTLTGFRFVAAPALVLLVQAEAFSGVALLLSTAWLSDFVDGKLARRASTPTRFGRWDMWADTAVGAGLAVGLILEGTLPLWAGVAALVLFGGLFLAGNLAAAMLVQLTGYLPLLWVLWSDRPDFWWAPFATFAVIGAVDWRRLAFINVPAFVRGLSGRFEHH